MKLRDFRKEKNLTLQQVGDQVGCAAITISRYENGQRMPRKAEMDRIRAWSAGAVTPNDFHDLPSGSSTSPEASPAGGNPSPSAGAPDFPNAGRAA